MPGYVNRFEAVAKSIEQASSQSLLAFKVNKPASSSLIRKMAAQWKVDSEILGFWAEADGLTLVWRHEDREEMDAGSLFGVEFGEIEGAATGIVDLMPLAKIAECCEDADESLYRIDNHQPEGGAAAKFDGARNPQVFYFDDEPHALKVDIAGYLELVLLTAGIAQWFSPLYEGSWYDKDLVKEVFPTLKLADLKQIVKASQERR